LPYHIPGDTQAHQTPDTQPDRQTDRHPIHHCCKFPPARLAAGAGADAGTAATKTLNALTKTRGRGDARHLSSPVGIALELSYYLGRFFFSASRLCAFSNPGRDETVQSEAPESNKNRLTPSICVKQLQSASERTSYASVHPTVCNGNWVRLASPPGAVSHINRSEEAPGSQSTPYNPFPFLRCGDWP